jgi:hypothetical protein
VQFAPRQDDVSAKLDIGRELRDEAHAALAAAKKRPARASRPETVKTLRPNQGQKKRGREYPTTFP